ncbi:MAG TPA: cyclase family protein, partial [Blastocatellia bacterium]|nr:cyclase family protein [Blastocatellia bacterium]
MRTIAASFLAFILMSATGLPLLARTTNPPRAGAQHKLTKADIDRMMTELSNWGRWGKEDQLGAINLITPAKRKQAASLVKEGVSVSLARDVEKEAAADNARPFEHVMNMTGANNPGPFSMDTYSVNYHGYAHTHIDALCHMFYQGKMYNGFPQSEVTQKGGARLSILNLKQGIFTRGI